MSNLVKEKLSAVREEIKKDKKASRKGAQEITATCIQQRSIVLDMLRLSNREVYGSFITSKHIVKVSKNLVYDGKRLSINEAKNVIATLIMNDVKELGRKDFIEFYQADIRALIAKTNDMLKVAKRNLTEEQMPNFSYERESNQESSAKNLARIANNFKEILNMLEVYKSILINYCNKPKLAQSVDVIYNYIKNELVPCFEYLSQNINEFFDKINNAGEVNVVFKGRELQRTTNVVKQFDVARDEYSC